MGVAAAVGLTAAGAGAAAISRGNRLLDENNAQTVEQVQEGTYRGTRQASMEDRESLARTLTNILPGGCPPEELISRAARASVQEVIDNNVGAVFPAVPSSIARRNLEDTRRNVATEQQQALGIPDEAFGVPTSALDTYELQQRAELLAFRRRLQGDADAPTAGELRELNDRESAITRQGFRELARERANTANRLAPTTTATQQLDAAQLAGLASPLPTGQTTEGDNITYNVNQTNNIETTETAEVVTDELVGALEDARFGR